MAARLSALEKAITLGLARIAVGSTTNAKRTKRRRPSDGVSQYSEDFQEPIKNVSGVGKLTVVKIQDQLQLLFLQLFRQRSLQVRQLQRLNQSQQLVPQLQLLKPRRYPLQPNQSQQPVPQLRLLKLRRYPLQPNQSQQPRLQLPQHPHNNKLGHSHLRRKHFIIPNLEHVMYAN